MAISKIEYTLLSNAREQGIIPPRPRVIEFGEQNWYGDIALERLVSDIERFVPDRARQRELVDRLNEAKESQHETFWFDIAKVFYETFLDYEDLQAIDLNGTDRAHRLDLNEPVDLAGQQFDLLLNMGTAEHVFNVYQFFENAHRLTKPGGLMVHGMPFLGWPDHGFYSFHPTFYFDLAAANDYALQILVCAEIEPFKMIQISSREHAADLAKDQGFGNNSLLYGVFKTPAEGAPFKVPLQGFYSGSVSEKVVEAWKTNR